MSENKTEPEMRQAIFKQLGVPCFFCSNGDLCCKIDNDRYIRFDFNREMTKIVEWDKSDFIQCNPVDLSYVYQRSK